MINLNDISTKPPKGLKRRELAKLTRQYQSEISELQHKLYAQGKFSLLVVFQGLDAAGKDSSIKNLFKGVPAFGISASAFKVPSKKELAHDFLWRVHAEVPEKGMIKAFNRSHYEDVLVTRALGFVSDEEAKKRFRMINNFEEIVASNNTIIVKFYLHISEKTQEKRLLQRMKDPQRFYKHGDGDWETRKQWDDYRRYYNECLNNTQQVAPWHIIPVDEKWYRDYLMAKVVAETLRELPLDYPPLETKMNINQ